MDHLPPLAHEVAAEHGSTMFFTFEKLWNVQEVDELTSFSSPVPISSLSIFCFFAVFSSPYIFPFSALAVAALLRRGIKKTEI